jgi:PAS domain S-box-containing protein
MIKKRIYPGLNISDINLIEHMNEAVWVGDKHLKTVYANPKYCEMTGFALHELIGKSPYDLLDNESAKRVRHENLTKRSKGISSSYETNHFTKRGKKVPILVSGSPLPGGGTIAVLTDLTKLKQKEENERILNSAIQYATDAIIIFDKSGNITSWNKGAKIIFGYKKEELMGKNIDLLFSKKDCEALLKKSKVLYNFELKGKHKNRRKVVISVTFNPILNEEKKCHAYLLIARDVTNKNKFEEELALKYKKIQEAYNKFGILKRQMDYIFEILDLFQKSGTPKNLADFIVSSMMMLTHVDASVLRLYNPKKKTLELVSCFGVFSDWKGKAGLKLKNSLAEKAFLQKSTLKILDIASELRYQSPHLARKNNLCSLLLIPLQFQGKLIGSMSLYVGPDKRLEIFENDFIEKYAKLIEILLGILGNVKE